MRGARAIARAIARAFVCRGVIGAASLGATAMGLGAQAADSVRGGDEGGALTLAAAREVQLTLGGYLQVDGRWLAGSAAGTDGLLLRRARLVFDAAAPSGWHLRLQPDFGQGRVQIQDAFVGRTGARLTARIGRFRPAFGTERMQSSSTLLFPERGLVNSLMPSRSMGAQLLLTRGNVTLGAGGFRTPIGSDSPPVDTDGDVAVGIGSGHDLLARAAWRHRAGARYLDVHLALLQGRERGTVASPALARLLTVGQQPLVAFRNDGTPAGTALAAGARQRVATGVLTGNARGMLSLEAAALTQQVAWQERVAPIRSRAVSARAAWVFGGIRRESQEIVPRAARGAFEIGARAGLLAVDLDEVSGVIRAAATSTATRRAGHAGVAASWLPHGMTRVALSLDVTHQRAGPVEHALAVRVQQGF